MQISEYLSIKPKVTYISSYDPKPETGWDGIRALWYEGALYKGKKKKVFAYIGYPEIKKGKKVPAVVLVHGGGGHPYAEWIKQWNDRGYAAIAMELTGQIPSEECMGLCGIENGKHEKYVSEFYGEWVDDAYILGPDNDMYKPCDSPLDERWLNHAIADTILAHNILREDENIDVSKIGICGVSWGGVITSLVIGYDQRYAFAIPIYGSAYLGESDASCSKLFRDKQVKQFWNATDRIDRVSFPVFWLCWLPDPNFCAKENSSSYLATKAKGGFLSVKEDMLHGHLAAWRCEEGYHFADSVIKGELPFVYPIVEPNSFGKISFSIEIPPGFEKLQARVVYMAEPLKYASNSEIENKYYISEATIIENTVTAIIPEDAYCYYIEFSSEFNGKRLVSSTSLVFRK